MECVEGLPLEELEAWLREDPVPHLLSWKDRTDPRAPVHFVRFRRAGRREGYALYWFGNPQVPVVHWFGDLSDPEPAVRLLPPRPLVVVGPPPMVPVVDRVRGPVRSYELFGLLHSGPVPQREDLSPAVRAVQLEERHRDALNRLVAEHPGEGLLEAYARLNLQKDLVFAAVEGPPEEILSVARVQARTPWGWLVAGVYTRPEARRRGGGRAVLETILSRAHREHVPVALYARADNSAALNLYRKVGFREVDRRVWMDAGSGLSP
jgi:GNAT superfamily N-acetyltransferase